MIPHLFEYCKEVMMNIKSDLLELEAAAQKISDGLSAIHMMVLGMEDMDSQYTGALHAIWDYLSKAEQEFLSHLHTCLKEA